MFQPVLFIWWSDVVVIGYNPENADISNPKGAIHGYAAYVLAEDAKGNRLKQYVKTDRWESEAVKPANELAQKYNHDLRNGIVPDLSNWEMTHGVYGSDAHSEQELCEWERSLED